MKIPAVLFLVGTNSFLSRLRTEEIRQTIFGGKKDVMNDLSFDAKQIKLTEILDLANTTPMFANQRLIILRNIDRLNEEDQNRFIEYLSNPSPQTIILGICEKLDKRLRFTKALEKTEALEWFEELKPRDMPAWLDRLLKRQGLSATPQAKQLLLDALGTDLQALSHELDRLSLFLHPKKDLDDQTVREQIMKTRSESVFEWTDQVVDGRAKEAMETLQQLLGAGDHALVLLAMLTRHIRILLKAEGLLTSRAPQNAFAPKLGVPPFLVGRYIDQARRHSRRHWINVLSELAKLDREFKSTGMPPEFLLERSIRTISDLSHAAR